MKISYNYRLCVLCAFFCTSFGLYSQTQPDSVDIAYYSKKNGINAGLQIVSLNMGIWTWGKHIRCAPYSNITIHSIKQNFRKGFHWDFDGLDVNMLAHPYHGALFFNSARSNGYNFWQSGLFSIIGSATWEFFMENEYPSQSDILATPLGGVAFGEAFYRLSDLILDDRLTGGRRFAHELLACIISPTRSLTRILSGNAWKRRATSGKQFGTTDVAFSLHSGVRFIHLQDVPGKATDSTAGMSLEYGDCFSDENSQPFDYFTMNLTIASSVPSLVTHASLTGRYACTALIDTKKAFLNLGVYQHFDYYNSAPVSGKWPYRLGIPAAGGIGMIYQSKQVQPCSLDVYVYLNGIVAGGIYTDYFRIANRDYNFGSGFGWKSGIHFSFRDKFRLSAAYKDYRLFTWKGYAPDMSWDEELLRKIQGDRSQATFQVMDLQAHVLIGRQWYLSGGYCLLNRRTHYRDFPTAFSRTSETTLMLEYWF